MSIDLNLFQNILIIRFSSIGDIILTTSVVNTLKKANPDLSIDFLTLEKFAPIIEHHENINKILVLNQGSSASSIKKFGRDLDERGYDLVLDLHNTLRSKLLMSGISRTPHFRLKKPRLKRFLLFYLLMNRFSSDFNQIKLLHSPLEKLQGLNKTELPSLTVSDIEKEEAEALLKKNGIHSEYGVCVPGAAWKNKMWPAENYISFLKKFTDIQHWVLIGGANDLICQSIAENVNAVTDLHGQTGIRQSLSIISGAKVVLGSDTGMVHAAEALGVPVVTILGPTSRETGAGVNQGFSLNVQKDVWCRPCSQNGSRKCYRKHQVCMTEILPEDVYSAVKTVTGT